MEKLTWSNDGWPVVANNGAVATSRTAPAIAHAGLDVAIWHQGLGDNPHPVLYPGVDFDEGYDYSHKWEAENDATVYFYRSFSTGMWNTLCVPFDMTVAQVESVFGEGTKLATLRPAAEAYTASNQTMHFVVKSEATVEAGVPYLVMPTASSLSRANNAADAIKIDGVTVKKVDPQSASAGSDYTYWGTYDKTTHPVGDLFVAANNKLSSNNVANGVMKGFRTYFEKLASNNAKPLLFTVEEDEPTGINSVYGFESIAHSDTAVYDLQGRKVAETWNATSLQPGIYVVKGKKVVIK